MEHSKLRINFKDRRGNLVTATYNLKGAKYAIGKVLAACDTAEDLLDE